MIDDVNNPRFQRSDSLGFITLSDTNIDTLIGELQNIKDQNQNFKYLTIKCEVDGFDGDYELRFNGIRLESDEEYQNRLDILKKREEKESKRKLEQFDRELKTIKTLMKKNKITNIDLDKENNV